MKARLLQVNPLFLRRFASLLYATALALSAATAAEPTNDFGATIREFSARRHKLTIELSEKLGFPVPDQVHEFFKAAEAGDWLTVSNRFEELKLLEPVTGANGSSLIYARWAPVHESLGVYESWRDWKQDSSLLAMFYQPILDSMPTGSVYFCGTDPGRFVITTATAVRDPQGVFCLTQNAFADTIYEFYLHAVHDQDLWLPKVEDDQRAFQQYVSEVQSGKHGKNAPVTIQNGRVTVSGVKGVMAINGILCQKILEHNPTHPFFIEESYVIKWMYPYLEPHGLIFKLNDHPLADLSAETIQRDTEFWRKEVEKLQHHPGFAGNLAAQKTFAKLRAASAGLYLFRQRFDLAEAAFLQAVTLCPVSPEASFRLAEMYEKQGEIEKARKILSAYLAHHPDLAASKAQHYLSRLDLQRALSPEEKQRIENLVRQLGATAAKDRADARQQLQSLGPPTLPVLKSHPTTTDPEVKITLQELIQKLESDLENARPNSDD